MRTRSAVVTGSASGLGAAVRRRLEGDGYEVVGVDLAGQEIDADLSTVEGCAAMVGEVTSAAGGSEGSLDAVVACAGLGAHVADTASIAAVNYFGAVATLDGLLPLLRRGDTGAAVAVSSNSVGLVPADPDLMQALREGREDRGLERAGELDGSTVYGNSKLALARAVRRRAEEWGGAGVRLNAVAPGPFDSQLLQGSIDDATLGPLVDALPIPLDRRATADEVAEVIAFLLSEAAAYVHGSVLFVDGGTDALTRPDEV